MYVLKMTALQNTDIKQIRTVNSDQTPTAPAASCQTYLIEILGYRERVADAYSDSTSTICTPYATFGLNRAATILRTSLM